MSLVGETQRHNSVHQTTPHDSNSNNNLVHLTEAQRRSFHQAAALQSLNGQSTAGRITPQEQQALYDNVSRIMSTASIPAAPPGSTNYTTKRQSSTTSTANKRLTKKFQKGQLRISSPEGFRHVSGGQQQSQPQAQQHAQTSQTQQPAAAAAAAAASATPASQGVSNGSTASVSSVVTSNSESTANSSTSSQQQQQQQQQHESKPPVPQPPSTKGPPVRSYRESMALRSGVLLEPSSARESRFSKALGTPNPNPSSSPNPNSNPPQSPTVQIPQRTASQSSQQSLSSPVSAPYHPPHPKQSRESKRISRLPWKREKVAAGAQSPSFNISEPILEYSTSEIIHETQRASRQSIPLSEYYPNGPPGHERLQTHHTPTSSRSSSTTTPMAQHPQSFSPQLQQHNRQFSQQTASSNGEASRFVDSRSSKAELSPVSTAPYSPVAGSAPTSAATPSAQYTGFQKSYVPQTPAYTPASHPTAADLEIAKWRQKCRDSDEKRRAMMVDYQQKLDAERKTNMEMEKKMQELIREKAASAANVVTFSAPQSQPENVMELNNKIKSLESQRKALKEALQNLRETKDLKINEYENMLARMKRKPVQGKPEDLARQQQQQEQVPQDLYRVGISPLLPTAAPVQKPVKR